MAVVLGVTPILNEDDVRNSGFRIIKHTICKGLVWYLFVYCRISHAHKVVVDFRYLSVPPIMKSIIYSQKIRCIFWFHLGSKKPLESGVVDIRIHNITC